MTGAAAEPAAASPPRLWHFAISHFTEKARWALDWKRVPHVRQMLFLDYPVRSLLRTGQIGLPVLFDGNRTIVDSTAIIAHLEREHPDPPLYPGDPAHRAKALALEDFFDEELGPHLRALVVDQIFHAGPEPTAEIFGMGQREAPKRLVRAVFPVFRKFYEYRHQMSPDRLELGREKLARALDRLESEIGDSDYLVGNTFTVADLTAAALFYPIAMPAEYPFEFPPVYREILESWLEPLRERRAVEWVGEIYRRHRGRSAAIAG